MMLRLESEKLSNLGIIKCFLQAELFCQPVKLIPVLAEYRH